MVTPDDNIEKKLKNYPYLFHIYAIYIFFLTIN